MIMSLLNAHNFFKEKVFIQIEDTKFFLIVIDGDTFYKKECKSPKGAKIAFIRCFGYLNPYVTEGVWTSFYSPTEKIELPNKKYTKPLPGLKNKTVNRAIDFVKKSANLEMSWTRVKYIASQIGVNESYLSRKFKEDTGMYLIDFINAEKMLRAVEYAGKGMDSKDVSIRLGFSRCDYFRSLFKHRFYVNYQTFKSGINSEVKEIENI